MLVGGDLGFRSLVVLVLAFLGPVIGFFVVRRKWRLAIARREEVKRLLVLASEEAARAELEATAGSGYGNDDYIYEYASPAPAPKSNSRPVQYECAVCFSPTATRCARCKSIRYCSGKCQIIHWRQGHKEECRPFTFANQTNDVEGGSDLKVSKPEKHEASVVAFGIEERPFAKPVGDFSDSVCSGSDHPEVLLAKAGKGVKCFTDGIGTTATSDTAPSLPGECTSSAMAVESSVDCPNTFETPNGYQSDNVPSDKRETNFSIKPQIRTSVSAQPTLVNSVLGCTSSDKLDENRPSSCGDRRTQHVLASSSGRSSDGSDESSLSEPSTPCSDFWEGATKSSKSRIVADDARSSSSETRAVNTSDGIPSTNSSFDLANNVNSRAEVHCPNMKATSDNVCPGKSVFKKPSSSSGSSRETGKNCSRSGRSPSYSSDMFDHNNIATINNSHMSKSRDVEYCSSASNSHPALSNEGRATKKDASKISSLPFLCPERPNLADNDSHALKSKGAGHLPPKAADVNLSSTNGRHSVQSNQSVKVDYAPGPDACSTTQFEGYSQNNKNGLKTSMLKVVDQIRATKLSRHYPSVAGNEMAGSYNKKGLFSYELFVKLYNSNKVDMRPCGLINCGNSCYANAVLQCLAFTPPLTAYLLQGFHSKACEKRDWCFSCEFESLLLKVKEGISPLTPIRILSQIQSIGSHLGHGREEDAHEFLRYAVDTMQADCLKEVGVKASGSFEEETTLIGLTFGGYLRSKIRCMRCGGKSERHERMMDLTVEIGGDIGTLEEALRQFTGTEILDGENKYQCSRCKSYERAKKKLTVLEAPNILTIALKRFQSGKFGKLNKSIRFPEILNLAPFMSGTSDKSPVYRLYGVVVHLDIMNAAFSGHYVCYVKNIQNKWFKIDDSTVKAVELEKVLEKGAYMLLYARCSPRAPKFIRNSIITHDLRKPKSRYHPTNPWDFSKADILNRHMTGESIQTILEEDSSSDHSSSLFSEAGSCSTESSNRDSTSNEDYFDQILGDFGQIWRNSSDSDTSSSSSSPSPLYTTRHSPLADLDRYAANCEMEKKASVMNHDSTNKLNRKLVNSSSCRERERERERDSGRLGRSNPFEEGEVESLRRSTRD